MKANPYLSFAGNCREAFEFYQKLFGGKIVAMMTAKGSPMEGQMGPNWDDKIMHARLVFGENVLMGSDSPAEYYAAAQGTSICVTADSIAEAERIFAGLAEGGEIRMPIEETFFANRFGMVTDRFGSRWMVVNEKPMG